MVQVGSRFGRSIAATLALFIALGGASYAATNLPRNGVGSAQIKDGAVTFAKLSKPTAARLKGLRGLSSAVVTAGEREPQGEKGSAAVVDGQLKEQFWLRPKKSKTSPAKSPA